MDFPPVVCNRLTFTTKDLAVFSLSSLAERARGEEGLCPSLYGSRRYTRLTDFLTHSFSDPQESSAGRFIRGGKHNRHAAIAAFANFGEERHFSQKRHLLA